MFEFGLILHGRYNVDQEMELCNALIEAGCDFPEVSSKNNIVLIEFTSDNSDYRQAILDDIYKVEAAGAKVAKLANGDSVSISDIARRSGIRKMTISRYSRHQNGCEDFPAPLYGDSWSWLEVAQWLLTYEKIDAAAVAQAEAARDIEQALLLKSFAENAAAWDIAKKMGLKLSV